MSILRRCPAAPAASGSMSQGKVKIDRDPSGPNFCMIHPPRLRLNASMILSPRPDAAVAANDHCQRHYIARLLRRAAAELEFHRRRRKKYAAPN
jgi:hypothetical protein